MAAIERLKEKYLADQKILSQAEEVLKGQEVVPLEGPNIVDVDVEICLCCCCLWRRCCSECEVHCVGGWAVCRGVLQVLCGYCVLNRTFLYHNVIIYVEIVRRIECSLMTLASLYRCLMSRCWSKGQLHLKI